MGSAGAGTKRHLLIAGTGRTGTSFLVRYLTRLGLDTHLSRLGPDAFWNDAANAGLEDMPLPDAADLPYVIKSPWSYQSIHEVLESGTLVFDAVVLPMRDLTEAAASRTIVEKRAIHEANPWMADLDRIWETYGHTPGGLVYSLNPIDQARLLAVGFHQLLECLVRHEVPVILLSFPRLIEDADYLHAKLTAVFPDGVTMGTARAAHAATAEPEQVRVGREMRGSGDGFRLDGPSPSRLEAAALQRLLRDTRQSLVHAQATIQAMQAERDDIVAHRQAAEAAFVAMAAERDIEARTVCDAHDEIARMAEAHAREREALQQELELVRGSLRTFLTHYWPRLRRYLLRR